MGGLAGESSISSGGSIVAEDEVFAKHNHVFMIDENESSVAEELS